MAKKILENAQIIVNGVDLSDHADTITMEDAADTVDMTAFGNNGYHEEMPGLKTAAITAEFFSDQDAASVFPTIQPLYSSGTTFPVTVLEDSSKPVGANNKRGSMLARVFTFPGFGGNVGAASKVQVVFRNAGNGINWGTV